MDYTKLNDRGEMASVACRARIEDLLPNSHRL